MIKTNLIVACSNNGVIGVDGKIPWHIPRDFEWFKNHTKGKPIVMGRKTFESLPGRLPGRVHIVVSSTMEATPENSDLIIVTTLSDAQHAAQVLGYAELWVIGGERLYTEALLCVNKMYITNVDIDVPYRLGDDVARFKVDIDPRRWDQIQSTHYLSDINHPAFTFNVWKRRA